jgi:hypothetical protein
VPAGEPYLSTNGDAFLYETLGADPLLQRYCPGGVTGEKPADGDLVSVVRFWVQSAGRNKPRQDGALGRVLSTPTYIVVALDRQKTGSDKVFGSVGSQLSPPEPYLQLAQKRIYDLLHGRLLEAGGFTYEIDCFADYPLVEPTTQGWRDVHVGWWVRMLVQ